MNKRIGVIGGGIVGSSIAYFLSSYPDAEVTLFEKATIGSGTTVEVGGDVLSHRRLGLPTSSGRYGFSASSSTRALENDEPGSTGFEQTGTLTVAPYRDYETYVKQAVDLTVASGYRARVLARPREDPRDHPRPQSRGRPRCRLVPRRRFLRRHHDRQHPRAPRTRRRRERPHRHQGRRHHDERRQGHRRHHREGPLRPGRRHRRHRPVGAHHRRLRRP